MLDQNAVLLLDSLADPHEGMKFIKIDALHLWETGKVDVPNKREPAQFSKIWIASASKAKFRGVTFEPGRDAPADMVNLFRGFPVEPDPAASWSLIKAHMFDKLCQGDAELFHWLMAWCADIFQHPGDKMPSAAVIRGLKGTGKTTLFSFILQLLGPYGIEISNREQIVGRFNGHLANKLLIVADEAVWGGDIKSDGALKSLISSKLMVIEDKFARAVQMPSHCRVAFTTNARWAINATEDERRYLVLETADGPYRNTRKYFEPLYEQMLRQGGLRGFMHALLTYEYDRRILRSPKRTFGLDVQIAEGLKGPAAMLYRLLALGSRG